MSRLRQVQLSNNGQFVMIISPQIRYIVHRNNYINLIMFALKQAMLVWLINIM